MERMLMNPETGSVAPESEWRQIYADCMSHGEEGVGQWGGEEFDDAWLIEVRTDEAGNWVEV